MRHRTGASPRVGGWQVLIVFLCLAFAGWAQSARAETLTLFDKHGLASVVYDKDSGTPIAKAAALLSHDLNALSGTTPVVTADFDAVKNGAVVIGLASSPRIAALLKANNISTSPIAGKWETYGRAVVPAPWDASKKVLVIFGSDTRGTIWGVMDLTRELGVSPWEWWADVKIQKADRLAVASATRYSKEPSVKYRGFFLNTPMLSVWAHKNFDQKQGGRDEGTRFYGIGPKTYGRVFEIMWRLKANMLWTEPSFTFDPANYKMLQDYGVVRGTSHVEMMLQSNTDWNEETMGPYNWVTNKQHLIDYWKSAAEKWGKYDNQYTVGMRGANDFPMEGADSAAKMADVLTDVIAAQRKILTDVLKKPADQIPQVFTPYKEVTAAYNTGRLKLPDDVILNWPEDNYGYVMQLSSPEEQKRPGGSGVYYHADFWGAPGNYLWLGSTDPSLMWEEMTKAHHFGARQLWVLNSGSIKPLEYLTELFLAMSFDIDSFSKPASVREYLRSWAQENFGAAHRDEIADIMWQYYKLAFDRNPEFMAFSTTFPETAVQQTRFNITDFGDENARRANAYKDLMARADKLAAVMPVDRESAFYELVQFTVKTGGAMNIKQLAMDKSIAYGLQRRASASVYAEESEKAHAEMVAAADHFNKDLENGKWNPIISTYPQTLPNYLPPAVPKWKMPTDWSRCGVQVDGGGFFEDQGWWFPTLPTYSRELGSRSYYMDIFTEQAVDATWSATPKEPWIKIDRTSGAFSPATKTFEQRLNVSIDWSKAPKQGAEGLITVQCSSGKEPIDVHVRLAPPLPDKSVSFIDAQGVVSIYAAHADSKTGAWRVLDGFGHTGADVQADLDMAPVNADDAAALAKAPKLVYRFATTPPDRDYSFPNYVIDEIATLRAIALPVFPTTKDGKLRIAVSVDSGTPKVLDFSVLYYGAKWRQNVLDNAAVAELHDIALHPGSHTLTVWALDPGVTLDRFEIAFAGSSQAYGPIPETKVVNRK